MYINQVPPQYLSLGSALSKQVPNPFYGTPYAVGILANPTVTQAQLLRPFPEYGTILDYVNLSKAQYDSLVLKLNKRLSKGVTFITTFTWQKNQDNEWASGGSSALNAFTSSIPNYPQNVYNLGAEWALAATDAPWRYTIGYTWDLPFGKGKAWMNQNTVLDYIVGGWSLNGITIIQSGMPLFIYQSNSNSVIGTGEQRPNATGVAPTTSGSPESRYTDYINPAAFSLAPQFTFGNVARSIPNYGPGMANWDVSLFKSFTFHERYQAQFRAEFLNLFNTPFFAPPVMNYSSGSFGQISYQDNFPRELQLGIRFAW
jgi:hypothetical protein